MRQAGLAYAQTRLQARLADLPSARDWQLIETGRDFSQTLDTVKQGSLARFVSRLSQESDEATIEHALRQSWGDLVDEVAGWAPERWQDALRWMTPLPHLRLPHAWPDAWPDAGPDPDTDRTADARTEADLSESWRAEFLARVPVHGSGRMESLAPLFDRYLQGPPERSQDAPAVWVVLESLFRSRRQEPVALLAWLGMMALVFERLRGALLLALLFPATAAPPETEAAA